MMSGFLHKGLRLICIGLLLFALAGCANAVPDDEVYVIYVTPSPTQSTEPTTPTPILGASVSPEASPESTLVPNGIAEPGDVLPPKLTYEEYKGINPDVIGWITVSGTNIDYPVVRCDNNNYYLSHLVEGTESKHGAIFMDYRNADKAQQRHIILYGHNMSNGTMFRDLMNFKQRDFFNEHRTIKFLWDGVQTEWEIYLAYLIKPKTIYHIHTLFGSDQNFVDVMNGYIDYSKSVTPSQRDESVSIRSSDQVLTLSTCSREYDGSFFAVSARRVQ